MIIRYAAASFSREENYFVQRVVYGRDPLLNSRWVIHCTVCEWLQFVLELVVLLEHYAASVAYRGIYTLSSIFVILLGDFRGKGGRETVLGVWGKTRQK